MTVFPARAESRAAPSNTWRRQLDDTADLFHELQLCRTIGHLCVTLLDHARRFGADHLLAGLIPRAGVSRREQLSHVLFDAWPREWSERYFSSGYLYRDPAIRLVTQGSTPFLWREIGDLCKINASSRRVMDEARAFQLKEGLTCTFSTIERQPIGFSFAGERLDPDPRERAALEFLAAYAVGCAIALVQAQSREPVRLSPRQHDVLRWAAEGFTLDQIAERLNLSVNTIDAHLRAIRQRLGVGSTLHAVVEAFRLGLIR